jgi:hypothetical protein
MHRTLAAVMLLLGASPAVAADDYAHYFVKNNKLKYKIYDVHETKAFYRGTRFNHAGVFGEVEFAGHKIFGPWKDKHDPTNHDDIIGPCDEFGIEKPLGYDEAKVGGTFLKIGVGELEKPKEEKYSFAKKYKIVKPLEWWRGDTGLDERTPAALRRTEQAANGYGYRLTKVVTMQQEPEIRIDYLLKNTGEKRIVTDFYNHNFFNVDGDSVGPNYSFAFPFEPKAENLRGKFGDLVELKGKEFRFKDKLPSGDFVMAGLTGFDPKDKKQWFEMRHAPSGVRVKVEYDYPLAKFNVWGIKTTICPEPYMAIDLKPGEEAKWTITYAFAHEPKK